MRLASEQMDACLRKGADARKHSISLGTLEYSGDLSSQMLLFSQKMGKVYKVIQDMVTRKVQDELAYKKYFAIIEERMAWYEKAEVRCIVCHIMLRCFQNQCCIE